MNDELSGSFETHNDFSFKIGFFAFGKDFSSSFSFVVGIAFSSVN